MSVVDEEDLLFRQLASLPYDVILSVFRTAVGCEESVKPNGCAYIIKGCLLAAKVVEHIRPPLPSELDNKLHTMMVLITRPMTEEHIRELDRCTCAGNKILSFVGSQWLHRAGLRRRPGTNERALTDVITLVSLDLCAAVAKARSRGSLFKVNRNAKRAARIGEELHFPREPSDLFPFDPSVCINSLARWMRGDPKNFSSVQALLCEIVTNCPSEGIPALIASPNFLPSILNMIISMLMHLAVGEYTSVEQKQYWSSLESVSEFFEFLRANSLSNIELIACFTASGADFFLSMCNEVLGYQGLMEDLPHLHEFTSKVFARFQLFGAEVHHGYSLPHDPDQYHPDLLEYSLFNLEAEDTWFTYVVVDAFAQMLFSQRCNAPGCTNTQSRLCATFLRCGQCMRAPYCSPECQRNAWRHDLVPHKSVCRSLREIARVMEMPLSTRGNWVPDPELLVLIPIRTANRVGAHITLLSKLKMAAMGSDPTYGAKINQWISGYALWQHQRTACATASTELLNGQDHTDYQGSLARTDSITATSVSPPAVQEELRGSQELRPMQDPADSLEFLAPAELAATSVRRLATQDEAQELRSVQVQAEYCDPHSPNDPAVASVAPLASREEGRQSFCVVT